MVSGVEEQLAASLVHADLVNIYDLDVNSVVYCFKSNFSGAHTWKLGCVFIGIMAEKSERIPRYQELKRPEFKSSIPDHLVTKLSDEQKYIIMALSKMESEREWLINSVLELNRSLIETDLRTQELQDWQSMVSSKWAVVGGFLLLCLPILLEKVLTHLIK